MCCSHWSSATPCGHETSTRSPRHRSPLQMRQRPTGALCRHGARLGALKRTDVEAEQDVVPREVDTAPVEAYSVSDPADLERTDRVDACSDDRGGNRGHEPIDHSGGEHGGDHPPAALDE